MSFRPTDVGPSRAKPLLSICIPTFNRATILAQTLQHLRGVCHDDVEIVISDNCSTDQTPAVIAAAAPQFAHFRAIRQRANRGAMRNFAAAIALAGGQFTYTLSDDDEVCMDGLRAAMDIMQSAPTIAAVYGAYQEWIRETAELTQPIRAVSERVEFERADKLKMLNRFSLLWFPVCRTPLLQRFFTYEERSFGFWELVGALLDRGRIAIIPEVFYKHAHTQPRMEYELTQPWYHDAHRAQHELYLGRLGPGDFGAASAFVNARVAPAYLQGLRFAGMKQEFLTARHFLLRARAYGLIAEKEIVRWERQGLVGMVAERVRGYIELLPDVREVLFEDSPRLKKLQEHFRSIAPAYSVSSLSETHWAAHGLRDDCFLLTHDYGGPGWETAVALGPIRYRAIADVIESCRLTDQPLDISAQ